MSKIFYVLTPFANSEGGTRPYFDRIGSLVSDPLTRVMKKAFNLRMSTRNEDMLFILGGLDLKEMCIEKHGGELSEGIKQKLQRLFE